ncbi:MAG: hypothetical protein MJ138_07060, partial [Kiritimatiellae bacterium]|nr:hypothetical protein [Kiritimatiellia bacterium]
AAACGLAANVWAEERLPPEVTVDFVGLVENTDYTVEGDVYTFTSETAPAFFVNGAPVALAGSAGAWTWTKPSPLLDDLLVVAMKSRVPNTTGRKWYENPLTYATYAFTFAGGDGSDDFCKWGVGENFIAATSGFGSAGVGGFSMLNVSAVEAASEGTFKAVYPDVQTQSEVLDSHQIQGGVVLENYGRALIGSRYQDGLVSVPLGGSEEVALTVDDTCVVGVDNGKQLPTLAASADGRHVFGAEDGATTVYKYRVVGDLRHANVGLEVVETYPELGVSGEIRTFVHAGVGGKDYLFITDDDGAIWCLDCSSPENAVTALGVTHSKKCGVAVAGVAAGTPHLYVLDNSAADKALAIYDLDFGGSAPAATLNRAFTRSQFSTLCGGGDYNNAIPCDALAVTDDETLMVLGTCRIGAQKVIRAVHYVPPVEVDFSGSEGCASVATNGESVGESPYLIYTTSPAEAKTLTFTAESGKALASVTVNGAAVDLSGEVSPKFGDTEFTFTADGAENESVAVKFVEPFAATVAPGKGTVTPDAETYAPGAAVGGTVADVAEGYAVAAVFVNGKKVAYADGAFSGGVAEDKAEIFVAYASADAWYLDPFQKVEISQKGDALTGYSPMGSIMSDEEKYLFQNRGPASEPGLVRYAVADLRTTVNCRYLPTFSSGNLDPANDESWRAIAPSEKYGVVVGYLGYSGASGVPIYPLDGDLTDGYNAPVNLGTSGLTVGNMDRQFFAGDYFYIRDYTHGRLARFTVQTDGSGKITEFTFDAMVGDADSVYSCIRAVKVGETLYAVMANATSDRCMNLSDGTSPTSAIALPGSAGTIRSVQSITGRAAGTPHLLVRTDNCVALFALSADLQRVVAAEPIAYLESAQINMSTYDAFAATDDEKFGFASSTVKGTQRLDITVFEKKPTELIVRGTFTNEAEAVDQKVAFGAAANCTFTAPDGCGVLAVKTNDVAAASAVLADSWTFTSDALTQHVYVQMTTTPKYVVTVAASGCTVADGAAAEVDVSQPYVCYGAESAAKKKLVFTPVSEGEPAVVYTLKSVTTNGHAAAFAKGTTAAFEFTATESVELAVTYVKPYQVSWTVEGGTCDADPEKTTDAATVVGGSSNFTFTATSGKYLKSVTVDGDAVELGDQLGETTYVYESAEDNGAAHTVSVVFEPRWDVGTTTVGGDDFATIVLDKTGKAFEGDTISGTISNVKEGYTAVVYVDGSPVMVDEDGKFSGTAQKSATVAVAFAKNTAWFMKPFVRNSFVRENGLYGHVQAAAYDATRDLAAFGLSTSGYVLERFSVSALTNAIGEAVAPSAAAAVAADADAGVGAAGSSVAALYGRGVFVSPNGAGSVMVSPADGVWGAPGGEDVASYTAEVKSASDTALKLACVAANEAGTMLYGMDDGGNLYTLSANPGDGGTIEYFQAADAP